MKRSFLITAIICLSISLSSLASIGSIKKPLKSMESSDSIRYLQHIFSSVDVQEDIVFGEAKNENGEMEKLLLDIYTPTGDQTKKRPVILWIHGGGFRTGINDKQQSYMVKMANDFAERGYVCISINYRVRDKPFDDIPGTMKDAMEDAITGLEWVRENGKKYNYDKNKIIIGGGSAGGILAVNLCYKDKTKEEKWSKKGIIALVDLWGTPALSLKLSTVDPKDPPTIIVHGTDDKLVEFVHSENLIKELESAGVKHELVTIEGGGHTPVEHMKSFNEKIAQFLYPLLNVK